MDAVEFIARHVTIPREHEGHGYFGHAHLRFADSAAARASLAADVNEVLRRNGVALRLTDEGRAERTGPAAVAASLHAWDLRTGDDTLDGLLAQVRAAILDPDPAPRAEALKPIWAAWERVMTLLDPDKKTGAAAMLARVATHPEIRGLLDAEAKTLTGIGDKFFIRHSASGYVDGQVLMIGRGPQRSSTVGHLWRRGRGYSAAAGA